jgi:predicted GH43/DUF377 family glycosyl hydrolase
MSNESQKILDFQKLRPNFTKRLLKTLKYFTLKPYINLGGLVFIFLIIGMVHSSQKQILKIAKKQKKLDKSLRTFHYNTDTSLKKSEISVKKGIKLPPCLTNLPLAENLGILSKVTEVNIRGVLAPYNPSLIETQDGYDLFFRYDILNSITNHSPYTPQIGVIHLNRQFQQDGREFRNIEICGTCAEDPRVIAIGDQLYLFCNIADSDNPRFRNMHLVNIDKSSLEINYETSLDMNLRWVEKNWSPFEYIDSDSQSHLFLEYQITPRKILELRNPQINSLDSLILPREISYLSLAWTSRWGEPRGGTPLKKVGEEYLGFFHSSFTHDNLIWYVMGAYTFEAQPPFRITGISQYPILFEGIFETPHLNTATPTKRVIFPSGFVVEKQHDRELIHVSCGENDSSVKILTFDKKNLLKSMNRL